MKHLEAKNRLGLVIFPAYDWAITPDHPEREERLLYTHDQIIEEGLLDIPGIKEFKPQLATNVDVARVHITVPDIPTLATTSHMISAGGAITAAQKYMEDEIDKAFALVRPPGHHAFRIAHGNRGFCNINNEAIMVEWLRANYHPNLRIAFVDTDAHHADGTQDIYYHDPNVLHISIHQDGRTLYPGTGFIHELGGPGALGKTLNIPLPPYTSDIGYEYVMKNLVLPILEDFQPDLIINSAGQDNHYSDPLTNMQITAQGYARINSLLNPDLAVLQGGYSIEDALPYINVGILLAMAGLDYGNLYEPDYKQRQIQENPQRLEQIKKTIDQLSYYWQHRDQLRSAEYNQINDLYYQRQRQILYDTDYITEEQEETVKVCSTENCPGHLFIESTAYHMGSGSQKTKIAAVVIFRNTCSDCHREGLNKLIEYQKDSRFDYVYLQDVAKDDYQRFTPTDM